MVLKIILFLSGFVFFSSGLDALLNNKPIYFDRIFSHGEAIPLGPHLQLIIGSILLIFGVILLPFKSELKSDSINYVKCPKCKKVFKKKPDEQNICSECNVTLEDLEGYFNRHPGDKVHHINK